MQGVCADSYNVSYTYIAENQFPYRNLLLKEAPGKKVLSEQPETDAFVTTGIGSRSELQTSVPQADHFGHSIG